MMDRAYLQKYLNAPTQRIALMGMSGVGKTTLSKLLPRERWFHYSVDYRIGTRYLNEEVNDFLKCEAMKVPLLAQLLRTDSIFISSNLTIENLAPLSAYLGMVGDINKGGLALDEFCTRLEKHRYAEISATKDIQGFIDKSQRIYGYQNFICDTSGSLCELDDPSTWELLASNCLLIYIRSTEDMQKALIERAQTSPKPLYYQRSFLIKAIAEFCTENNLKDWQEIDPAIFVRWVFPHLVKHRLSLYQSIADRYGITVCATETANIRTEEAFLTFVHKRLEHALSNN